MNPKAGVGKTRSNQIYVTPPNGPRIGRTRYFWKKELILGLKEGGLTESLLQRPLDSPDNLPVQQNIYIL